MATQLCQKCKQAHPGRVCDYDEKAECAETIGVDEVAQPRKEPSNNEGGLRFVTIRSKLTPRVLTTFGQFTSAEGGVRFPQEPYRLTSDRKESSSRRLSGASRVWGTPFLLD